ncbi:DUF2631 domain-containing protein [Rhodococcus sp. NPDC058521]|uniref:DUF2631 domain-containing protein n=1 Tax=Rhodococcus sp. NPDC058521 TaxID=3346536 RepID=UPI003669F0EB
MADTELDKVSSEPVVAVSNVDTAEVPSAEWGWSGESIKTFRFFGWLFAAFLLVMIIGNHEGRVEDWYLIGFAAVMVILLVRDVIMRRKPR